MKPRVAWQADSDGVGHVRIGRDLRTPCGRRPIDPRHAWPLDSRCETCTAAVVAITQGKDPSAAVRPG